MTNWADQIYRAHQQLLEQVQQGEDTPDLVARARELVEQGRRAGAHLHSAQERAYVESLLGFWGNWLYRASRIYPNTDLYPPSPEAPAEATVVGRLQPSPVQSLIGSAQGENVSGRGTPFLMVSIVSPANGAQLVVGQPVPLTGMYANVRPPASLFCFAQDTQGRLHILDEGYAPQSTADRGIWIANQPFMPPESGVYRLGVVLAIIPDTIEQCQRAFSQAQPIAALPDGALVFDDLVAVVAR